MKAHQFALSAFCPSCLAQRPSDSVCSIAARRVGELGPARGPRKLVSRLSLSLSRTLV
jgi:hypothetical protein